MSTNQSNVETGLTKVGPFSPTRYNGDNALEVGLPSPEAMNLLVLFSQQMVGTPFVPKALGNGPNPAGNILAVILTGREEGFTPMEALRSYWMSPDGRLAKYADALMAKMRRAGFKFPIKEFSDTKAMLQGIRPDGEDYTSSFTYDEAKRAGLTEKDIWKKYPQRMLKARVIGDVYRFLASDLGGPTYTAEELQDVHGEAEVNDPEADQRRMEVLQAQEEKYTVKMKPKAEEARPRDAKPAPLPETAAEAAAQTPAAPTEATPTLEYHVYVAMPTAGKNGPKPVRCDVPPQRDAQVAGLLAQSMANDTGTDHVIMEVNTATGETIQIGAPYRGVKKPPAAPPAPETKPPATPPAEPVASKPPAAAATGPSPVDRMNALAELLQLPAKTATQRFNAYIAGFLGCTIKEVKDRPTAEKLRALESLEYTIHHDPDEFNSGPEVSGTRHRKWFDEVLAYLKGLWPKQSEAPAVELALHLFQRWGNNPNQFKSWTELDGIDLAFRPMEDVTASLRGFLRTRDMNKVLLMAKAHNLSVAEIIKQIETRALGCSLEEASQEKIEQAIEGFRLALRDTIKAKEAPVAAEKPAQEPEKPAPAAEETPAADDQDSLFGSNDW